MHIDALIDNCRQHGEHTMDWDNLRYFLELAALARWSVPRAAGRR